MQPAAPKNMPLLLSFSNRVARLLTQFFAEKANLAEMELQPQHMGVLNDLWRTDGLRQQDLAMSLIKDKATITRMISQLEQQNILVRVADHADRRIKRIYLTHKGRSLRGHLVPKAELAVHEATDGIDQDELLICLKVLGRIYKNLNSCKRND